MAAPSDNIIAITKAGPLPVGPGTRRRARNRQPSVSRKGFRSGKKTEAQSEDNSQWEWPQREWKVEPVKVVPLPNVQWANLDVLNQVLGLTNQNEPKTGPKAHPIEPVHNTDYGPYTPHYRTASYLRDFVDPVHLKERIDLCVQALKIDLGRFDAIAFTGMSGALIAPPVAMALGKSLIMVRKPGHSSHSDYTVEGDYAARRYVIVDDFRSSGKTEANIRESIAQVMPRAEYIGFLSGLYLDPYYVKTAEERGKSLLQKGL